MTGLIPMREEHFAPFMEEAVTSYAQDNATVGRWPEAESLARARAEFSHLLPDGLATRDHFLYEIIDQGTGETVGFMWFAVQGPHDARAGYLYNIRVKPEFRGRGHASAALMLLEGVASQMGLRGIGLHVFAFNSAAQALYRSLGYGITGFNMLKPLRGHEA